MSVNAMKRINAHLNEPDLIRFDLVCSVNEPLQRY